MGRSSWSWRNAIKAPGFISISVLVLVVVTAVVFQSLFKTSFNSDSRSRSSLTTGQTDTGTFKSKTNRECEQRISRMCVAVSVTENESTMYYCGANVLHTNSEIRSSSKKGDLFKAFPPTRKLNFGVTSYNPAGGTHNNVIYNSFVYKQFEAELTVQCKKLGIDIDLVPYFTFFPGELNSVEKGLLIRSSSEVSEIVRSFVASIAKKYGQSDYYEYEVEGDRVKQKLIDFTEESHDGRSICSSTLVQIMPPDCHPLFTHTTLHPVYQDMANVRTVLSEVTLIVFIILMFC